MIQKFILIGILAVAGVLFFVPEGPPQEQTQVYHFEQYHYVSDWDYLICALIQIESEDNPYAIGAADDVGVLQITPIYVAEVNRIAGGGYGLEQRTNRDLSIEMFEIYQGHHNPDKDIIKAIRLHNPRAGNAYLQKVLAEYEYLKKYS